MPGGGVGRNEPPAEAILRELKEEVGLISSDTPQFFGLYTRTSGLATNVIALYRLANVEVNFRPNLEIMEIQFADPDAPPPDATLGTVQRLAEIAGKAPQSPYW